MAVGIVQDQSLLQLSRPHSEVGGYLRKAEKRKTMTATEKNILLFDNKCVMKDAGMQKDAMRSHRERRQSHVEETGCKKTSDLD